MNRLPFQHSNTQIQIPGCPCCQASERDNWYDCPPGIKEGYTFAFCICTHCGHTRKIEADGVVPVPDDEWELMTRDFNLLYDVMYKFDVLMHRDLVPPKPVKPRKGLPAPDPRPQPSELMAKPVTERGNVPDCIECGNVAHELYREHNGVDRPGGFQDGDRMCCSACGLVTIYYQNHWRLVSNDVFEKIRDSIPADDQFRMDMLGVTPHNVPKAMNPEDFQEKSQPTVDNPPETDQSTTT